MTSPTQLRAQVHSSTEVHARQKSRSEGIANLSLRLEMWAEKYAEWLIGLTLLVFFAFRSLSIYVRHIWYDELATYYVARTFSWAGVSEALRLTADAQPPLYHLLQMPVLYLLGDSPHSLRWLTLFAGCVTLAATFVWLRRTTSAVAAIAGVVMLATSKLSYYSLEARPYALLLATTAMALASRGLAWRVTWLAVAVSLHYYALFVPLILALAERGWRRRLAYSLALSPLLITMRDMHPPQLASAGDAFAPNLYNLVSAIPIMAGASRWAWLALGLIAAIAWLRGTWIYRRGDLRTCWLLLTMVPICWLIGEFVTGIFFYRYGLLALLGLAGLAAGAIDRVPYRAIVAAGTSLICLVALLLTARVYDTWDPRPTARAVDREIAKSQLPVVMGSYLFLDVHHYLSAKGRSHFYRLTAQRPTFSTEYAYQPGVYDRWSEMIGKYAGFTPVGVTDWLEKHSTFLVLASDPQDWILKTCRQRGAQIAPIGNIESYRLYAVRVPKLARVGSR